MASPAAILSVLVNADTAPATAQLTKFDKQLAATGEKARKGIDARLGGTLNKEAFTKYDAALSQAARKAKDRAAFKAELGANFNNRAFNQYERALAKVSVETDAADAKTRHFNSSLSGIGTAAKYAAFGVAAAVAGAGAATIAFSVSFDRAMRNVNSIAQLSEGQFKSLEKQVLELSKATAQAPKTLAEGLYDLVSSGFKASDAVKVLAASAKAATAGLTDTATSTAAVAAVLNAYHRPAADAAKVSDTLFQTVNIGVISFEQLANTIGDVLPFAAQLHVSLNQVGAAVATMTKAGISPAETMTRIKNVFVALLKPSKDLSKAIKETGAASGEALIHQRGLQGALEAIIKTTDGSKSAVASLFPNIRALGGALALTGINAKSADKDVKSFANTTGATNKALSQQTKSVAYQWNLLRSTVEAVAIQAGSVLLPAMNKAIGAVSGFVQQMTNGTGAGGRFVQTIKDAANFAKGLFDQFQKGNPLLLSLIGGFIGLTVAIKVATVASAAFEAVMLLIESPIIAVVAAIGLIVGALTLLYLKNKSVHEFILNAWHSIKNVADAVFPTVAKIASTAFDVIKTAVTIMVTITKIQFDILKALWLALYSVFIHPQIKLIEAAITNILIPAFNAIKGPVQTVGKVIGDVFSFIWHKAIKPAMDFILGAFAALLNTLATVANVKLPFIGKIFGKTGDAIKGAADQVNNLKRQLDGLPAKKSTEVDVNVNFLSNVAGAIASIGATIGNVGVKVAGANPVLGHRAVGGMVDQPMIMVGEEAPAHPEVILATNPAYRSRNLGLWAQAGSMLGVPGFAQGGLANAGAMVSKVDPWTAQHAGSWMAGKAKDWVKGKFPAGFAGGGGASGANQKLGRAMMLAAGWPASQWPYLRALWEQESGWNANAVNPTSGAYGIPQSLGHGHPYDLGDAPAQIAWGLNYIRGRYGSPAAAEVHERAFSWYRKGGILGKIRGFAKGGIPGFAQGGVFVPGHPELKGNVSQIVEAVLQHFPGLSITATTGGTHAKGSYHYLGEAADLAGSGMNQASQWVLSSGLFRRLAEGIHNPNLSVKSGSAVSPSFWGAKTWADHTTHIHLAALGNATSNIIGGLQKKAPKFVPTKIPKLKLPFKAPKGLPFSAPAVTDLFSQMNGILNPDTGRVAVLSDLISSTSAIDDQRNSEYATNHPGLDTSTGIIGSTSGGKSILDNTFVAERIKQLRQLLQWQAQIRIALENALALIDRLMKRIQRAIAQRQAAIETIRSKIRENVARIHGLMGDEKAKGRTRRQRSNDSAMITALENQNKSLGGDPLKAGTGGVIGSYLKQIGTLRDRASTATGDRLAIVGASGIGGTLGQAKLDERSIEDLLRGFSPSSIGQALAAANAIAPSVGTAADNAPVTDTSVLDQLKSQLSTIASQTSAVYNLQGNVFSALDSLPPFGGVFHSGGIVPGALGSERTIIARAGETVSPAGAHVRVVMEDHRTRVFVNDVEQAIEQAGRRTSRTASRRLPGSTGR